MITTKKIKDYFCFLKIKNWWYLNGIFMIGFFYEAGNHVDWKRFAAGTLVSSLYLASGYTLNEYHDRVKHAQTGTGFLDLLYKYTPYLLMAVNLCISLQISIALFCCVALGAVLSWIYSATPFRLKRFSQPRLFLNALGLSLIFLLGVILNGKINFKTNVIFLYFVFLFFPVELIHGLNDMEDDGRENIKTYPLVHGIGRTIVLTVTFLGGLILFSLLIFFLRHVPFQFVLFTAMLCCALSGWSVFKYLKYKNNILGYATIRRETRVIAGIFGAVLLFFLFWNRAVSVF